MAFTRPPGQQAGTPRPTDPRTPSGSQTINTNTSTSAPNAAVAPPSPRTPRTPGPSLPFVGSGGLTLDSPFGADSPERPDTPPPEGVHGDIELELLALATALYNLGTTAINDNSREKMVGGLEGQRPDKKMGMKVNQVVEHLAVIDELSQQIDTEIPIQVLSEIDNGRNPMLLSRDRIERAALENQFMYGKLHAIETYTQLLDKALCENFPDLTPYLQPEEKSDVPPQEGPDTSQPNGIHSEQAPSPNLESGDDLQTPTQTTT